MAAVDPTQAKNAARAILALFQGENSLAGDRLMWQRLMGLVPQVVRDGHQVEGGMELLVHAGFVERVGTPGRPGYAVRLTQAGLDYISDGDHLAPIGF